MGAWLITLKDLRLLTKDRRAVVLLVLLPMVFIAIVGMSTGRLLTQRDSRRSLRLSIADLDHSEGSESLVARYQEKDGLQVRVQPGEADVLKMVDLGRSDAGIIIGPKFSERVDELGIRDVLDPDHGHLAKGLEEIDVRLELRPGLVDAEMLRASLLADIIRTIGPIVGRNNAFTRRFFTKSDGEPRADERAADDTPVKPIVDDLEHSRKIREKGEGVYLILVPGFTVMFVFFLVTIMARSMIAERDLGTLRRLRLAPISPYSILIGKTLPFYLISVLQVCLLFAAGRLLFSMSWGPQPAWLIPMILCTSLAATTLGLMLSTIVRTEQQVSAYGNSLVIILAAMSGCFMPRDWLPQLMQRVSLATPHAWALMGFDAVLTRRAVDVALVSQSCGILLAFSALFYLIGAWRFRSIA